jgi:DNA polymerase-3 subunit delta'
MRGAFSIPYQPTVSRLLTNALKSGRLHSAYMFSGIEGYGKWDAAVTFAAEILSMHWNTESEKRVAARKVHKLIHPDLHLLFPMPSPKNKNEADDLPQFFRQSKVDEPFAPVEYGRVVNILIEKVKELKRALSITPSEGGYRVGIIQQVERAPSTSFDILLKTIEEPPPMTVLILLTDNIRRLPATVVSRCQKVRFVPVASSHIEQYLTGRKGLSQEDAKRYARLSAGSFSEAYRLSQSEISERREIAISLLSVIATGPKSASFEALNEAIDMQNRDEVFAMIKLWQGFLRDILILCEGLPDCYLFNGDYKNDLDRIASHYTDHDAICNSMVGLLETQKLFYRNVPPRLALTELAWQLNELATGAA